MCMFELLGEPFARNSNLFISHPEIGAWSVSGKLLPQLIWPAPLAGCSCFKTQESHHSCPEIWQQDFNKELLGSPLQQAIPLTRSWVREGKGKKSLMRQNSHNGVLFLNSCYFLYLIIQSTPTRETVTHRLNTNWHWEHTQQYRLQYNTHAACRGNSICSRFAYWG